ncbi:MAG: FitA-like ribbon-helix-helix domain-containing protein [Luteimonas sp.]
MASITIRHLDDDFKVRPCVQAASHGRSMADEMRVILRAAVPPPTPVDGTERVAHPRALRGC